MSTTPQRLAFLERQAERGRLLERDLTALDAADLTSLPWEDRRLVRQGAVDLIGAMGDDFHRVEHRDGIPWSEAPLPPRKHACTAWSSEWFGLSQIAHCACGAATENIRRAWSNVNARRAPAKRWWERLLRR